MGARGFGAGILKLFESIEREQQKEVHCDGSAYSEHNR